MTAPSPSILPTAAVPEEGESARAFVAEIDRSCRLAGLALFAGAACWLAFGAVFGVIAAIKAHAPGFLAGPAWLTFGRVRPAATNALIYGFILQAGLGTGLWMICRLGRSLLQGVWMISGACLFWNIGVFLGIVGILSGDSTGHEWLEMPGRASPVLFCAFVLAGAWMLVTLHGRRERGLYVSQWFLLTSLLWFPWVYSTAQLFLVFRPVRGIMQAVVGGWYAHNLFELCLAPFALASIFYFMPKLLGRPLHSRGLALFGFWLLVLFGGWAGVRPGQPAPNWISGVSVVARVFLLIPILAFAMSWFRTISGQRAWVRPDWTLRFVLFAAASYVLAAVLETVGVLPGVSRVTLFTLYDQGVIQLRLHGFLLMALAGAAYYIVPRISGAQWPYPALVKLHFWCAAMGVALSAVALLIGGIVQGTGIDQPQRDFLSVVRGTVPFLGTSTLGTTLLLVAYLAFFINLVRLLASNCPCNLVWSTIRPPAAVSGRASR